MLNFVANEKGIVGVLATTKSVFNLGKIVEKPIEKCVFFIREDDSGLFALYQSWDGGYSHRLMPRESTETAESCYYATANEAIEAAKGLKLK